MSQQHKISPAMRENQKIEKAAVFIKKTGEIHRFALSDKLGMTTQQMNIFHPKLIFKLEGFAEYDKPSKTWEWVKDMKKEDNPLE